MATKTKAGGDGLALPPVRQTFDADAHRGADLARIADDLRALNRRHDRAGEIAAVLRENAEAYHRSEIGHDRFSEVGRAAWADAEREGVADLVLKAVRRA